ncbi:MAG: RloB family protein [Actinomycetota bacterium]|nr:RloB family protein [Actinomycetota bacterium]
MAQPNPRLKNDLDRKITNKKPRKIIEVHCEGRVTEPKYLNALKNMLRGRKDVVLNIAKGVGEDPLNIATDAIHSKRMGGSDEFWCAFDVDEHKKIDLAISSARKEGINLAISNPCFEVWLILHFHELTAPIETAEAVKLRARLDGSNNKNLNTSKYMKYIEIAQNRAQLLDVYHHGIGNKFPKNNPSTGMHMLIKSLGLEASDGTQ